MQKKKVANSKLLIYNGYKLFTKNFAFNKKSLFLLFFLFAFPAISFSQQLRAGLYGVSEFPVGELSKYYSNVLGEGLSAELSVMENFGISADFQIALALPKNDKIVFTKQFSQSLGLWYSLFLGQSGFSFEPSVEFGCLIQETNTVMKQNNATDKLYFDFIARITPSFRFRHENFLDNKVEVSISPVFSFVPQKKNILTYIGARAGLTYIFN